jgi:hypothetical protein
MIATQGVSLCRSHAYMYYNHSWGWIVSGHMETGLKGHMVHLKTLRPSVPVLTPHLFSLAQSSLLTHFPDHPDG